MFNYVHYLLHRQCLVLGHQIWAQSGSDWPQMGKIRDFFQIRFWLGDLKKSLDLGENMTHFGPKSGDPRLDTMCLRPRDKSTVVSVMMSQLDFSFCTTHHTKIVQFNLTENLKLNQI